MLGNVKLEGERWVFMAECVDILMEQHGYSAKIQHVFIRFHG